jgi:hypothetical protein
MPWTAAFEAVYAVCPLSVEGATGREDDRPRSPSTGAFVAIRRREAEHV